MANIYDMFPSKYLRAEDLKGKPYDLTIKQVAKEEMRSYSGAEPENKLVVFFDGAKKGLVLNKTNAFALADICGIPETDAWAGKTVQLYPTKVKAFGEMVDAIRVREVEAIPDSALPSADASEPALPGTDEPDQSDPFNG